MNPEQNTFTTIDEYIAQQPADVQPILQQIRSVIREVAPEATEKISYQMPTFYLNGNLVHFAAYKQHIGFYPTPSGAEQFEQELSAYKRSKGAVQFPLDQPMPYELIRRMVQFRAAENASKPARRK
jgi:uncharacterized protein YdhG (YjbR/CyaY superfamily)